MYKNKWLFLLMLWLGILIASAQAFAAPRDVQITAVNFDTGVVEVRNLGTSIESLSGWRFCSHNTSMTLHYSGIGGLNGISLEPGESLFVHYNNDATTSDEINIATIGGLFASLERDAYGLQLYFAPVNFLNGNTIADHLQWSLNGVDNVSADERSDEAESGGVWVDQTQWIAVASDTSLISLVDLSGAELHSPTDYVLGELPLTVPFVPSLFIVGLALMLAVLARLSHNVR